jgi:hypothetical protein
VSARPSPPKPVRLLLPVCVTCWTEIRCCSRYCTHGGYVHRDTELHGCGDRWPGSLARKAGGEALAVFRAQHEIRDEPAARVTA